MPQSTGLSDLGLVWTVLPLTERYTNSCIKGKLCLQKTHFGFFKIMWYIANELISGYITDNRPPFTP